jgi:hypothetical protein
MKKRRWLYAVKVGKKRKPKCLTDKEEFLAWRQKKE